MDALVCNPTGEINTFDVKDRFDFEDRVLHTLVSPRLCREYTDHHPSPHGVHVFLQPESHGFEARPYLEFDKHSQNETYFQVMQEGKPTGFKVVLSDTSWSP
jgi:hypothetical protein